MPEQIALAHKRRLANAEFILRDATDLTCFPDGSKDIVVIFGILHYVREWRTAIQECHQILRKGGKLFIEEPDVAGSIPLEKVTFSGMRVGVSALF